MRKPLTLLALWAVVAWVAVRMTGTPALLLDPPVLAFVLGVPLLAGLALVGPGPLAEAFRDALAPDARDLPAERRHGAANTLRSLGGTAVAAGVVGFVGVVIATFNTVAASGGQASPMEFLGRLPGMILGPLYGLALKAFLFDVLADGLEGEDAGLGAELE